MKLSPMERARQYLAAIPPAISGAGGHGVTFRAACAMEHGFALSISEALTLLLEWNCGCQPPWTEAELRHKLEDAGRAQHQNPRGYLLAGDDTYPAKVLVAGTTALPSSRGLPDRSGFGPGTPDQLKRLATMRPFGLEGLQWAQGRGALVFGEWHGFECFGLTDKSGRVLELRRMDGQSFPEVPGTAIGERKSHAVGGSQKRWPVGILEAEPYRCIALVEGIPDFLEAHYLALWEQASHYTQQDVRCAPVAMLSASPAICPEALPHFRGKHVRIFPHAEQAGLQGAARWERQLIEAGAATVDVFDFSLYRKRDGRPVNDLYDWRDVHPDHHAAGADLWKVLP